MSTTVPQEFTMGQCVTSWFHAPYTKESFDLHKEAMEIDLMSMYLECMDSMPPSETFVESASLYLEAMDKDDVKKMKDTFEIKSNSFLEKVSGLWKKFIEFLRRVFGKIIDSAERQTSAAAKVIKNLDAGDGDHRTVLNDHLFTAYTNAMQKEDKKWGFKLHEGDIKKTTTLIDNIKNVIKGDGASVKITDTEVMKNVVPFQKVGSFTDKGLIDIINEYVKKPINVTTLNNVIRNAGDPFRIEKWSNLRTSLNDLKAIEDQLGNERLDRTDAKNSDKIAVVERLKVVAAETVKFYNQILEFRRCLVKEFADVAGDLTKSKAAETFDNVKETAAAGAGKAKSAKDKIAGVFKKKGTDTEIDADGSE